MADERYKCPKCGDTESLRVIARVTVHLLQDGEDIQTVDDDANCDHDWDDDSPMHCNTCGWAGGAWRFALEGRTR